MANTYKNIVITPNISTEANVVPTIRFSGGDGTSNTDMNVRFYTASNGTLSFEGSAGQLFSVTNDFANSIFSVNDVSGIPSIDVYANGNIYIAPFGGNTAINDTLYVDSITHYVGVSTLLPSANLQVNGSMFITQNNTSSMQVIGEIAEFATNSNSYAQIHVRNSNNTGTIASGDLVVTADVGTDVSDFIDLGINNSGFNDTNWTINGRLDGYLYTSNGNLAIGVANTNRSLVFFAGGVSAAAERMQIDPAGSPSGNTVNIVGNTVASGAVYANAFVGFGTGFSNMNVVSTIGAQIWNVPPGVRRWKVTLIGAGGGGGGAHAVANVSGFGGGSGGVSIAFYNYVPGVDTMSFNVGLRGGYTATNANGTSGLPSNTNYNGVWTFANAGTGGANSWFGGVTPNTVFGLGGAASGGVLNLEGSSGGWGGGTTITSSNIIPLLSTVFGQGADTPLGWGQGAFLQAPRTGATAGANGVNAIGYGAGGSAGKSGASTTTRAGGFGANGVVIIEW